MSNIAIHRGSGGPMQAQRLFDPNKMGFVSEDFIGGSLVSGQIGQLGWAAAGIITDPLGDVNHRGLIRVSTGTTSGILAFLVNSNVTELLGKFDNYSFIKLNTNDANTKIRIGWFDNVAAVNPANGFYFEKLDADTNWFIVTRLASTETRTDTGIAVSTGWTRYRIRNTSGGLNISFTIDSNTEQNHTTNIPQNTLHAGVQIINSTTAAKTVTFDYWDYLYTEITR